MLSLYLFLSEVRDLAFISAELQGILVGSLLEWFLWPANLLFSISTTSPGLVSPANLQRIHSVSLIWFLMMLNSISPSASSDASCPTHGLVYAMFIYVIFNSLIQVPSLPSSFATMHRGLEADLANKDQSKTLNTSAFSHAFYHLATFSRRPTSFLVSLAVHVEVTQKPHRFQFQVSFDFPNPVPTCLGNISVFPFCYLSLLPPPYSSFLHLKPVRSSLFSQAGLLLYLLSILNIRMDCSCALRRLSLKIKQLSWVSLPSRADSQEILPTSSLNKPKSTCLKF